MEIMCSYSTKKISSQYWPYHTDFFNICQILSLSLTEKEISLFECRTWPSWYKISIMWNTTENKKIVTSTIYFSGINTYDSGYF